MKNLLFAILFLCSLSIFAQAPVKRQQTTTRQQKTTAHSPQKKNSSQIQQSMPTKDLYFSGILSGHNYVDLGLPSKTLWATCNIGATSPHDYGSLYLLPFIDGSIIRTSNDIAYSQWGNSWCMPSAEQFKELMTCCTCSWKSYKGVMGYNFIGPNGYMLFLPAAGWTQRDEPVKQQGEFGSYWSGTLPSSATPEYRNLLTFDCKGIHVERDFIGLKQSIRPVMAGF